MGSICQIQWWPGQTEYSFVLELQKNLVAQRANDEIPNTLLLLEHAPTYTVGIHGHRDHLLVETTELAQLNVAYHRVDRSGSVSYHGPGQLVGYPILNLQECGYSYHEYIAMLESVIIRALSHFDIHAFRQSGQRGIWVLPGKAARYNSRWMKTDDHIARIGTIGIKVNKKQITSYGFSINVNPDLNYFDVIVPRGVQACHVTSLEQVLNRSIEIGTVVEPVIQSFCELFELESRMIAPSFQADEATASQRTNLIPWKVTQGNKGL